MLASSIASFQNNKNDNSNNKSNSTSLWRCFIEKSSSLLRSPYTSIAIAGCYYFGVPLLQHHYKRATSSSMKNTVILAHDAVLNMFLEEHNKNVRSAVISILLNREKHEKGHDDDGDDDDNLNREKTAATSSPVSSSETDGSLPSILNFVKNDKTSSFVAVPIDLRINACLATLDEKQTEKCDDSGTTRKTIKLHDRGLENVSGVVRNIKMSKRELFASSEGRKALRSLSQHPRATSSSFSSSSVSETNNNDNDDEENDSDNIVIDEIRFPLFFALYDREKNNSNHLILSRDFLYKKNSLELAKLTIFALDSLALAKTTIRNSASTQPLEQQHQDYSILSSICKDFVSLYLACNLIGVKHYLFKEVNDQVEIRKTMSKNESDTNKNLDWTNNFILNLIPRLCAPLRNNNKNNSDLHFADKPSLLRSCAMIQHICRQSFSTTTSKVDCCDDHLRIFLESTCVLIPNVFSDNRDKECFTRCKAVPLFPFCGATSNLSLAATIFGNLYCEDDSSQFVQNSSSSSSLAKITSSSSLSNFFSAVSNEISSLATNISEDFIPLIHRSQLIKKAIRWVPMTALVLNVGLNFFFNTMSSIESSIDSKNSRVISSTDSNDNSGAPAVNLPILAALRAFAVQSNWLQFALLEFISSFTKYTTDAKMARRWFLLSMTSDFENSTLSTNGNNNKCENDEGGTTANRNHPNSSSSGGGVDTSFFFADSTITGALERTSHILESVPGLLQKMQQIMFEPSVNLATTITLLFFTTTKQDDSKNQIPLTLLDSLSPAPSFTKLRQWFSQICLKKYLAPFLLFVLIKRIHGFAEQRGTIEGGILNFYSTWQKRITLRQSTRMKNMMIKLLPKQEAETIIIMLTLDPFVNTAHIFGNSSGIASFQGFDGFEQFDEENLNIHHTNKNKIKKLKKETSRTNSENDIPQLHLDDGDDFDEEQQEQQDDDDDDTNNNANSNFQIENNMDNFDYLDNDSEDNFFWYVPELERRQYSDRQDERRKRRRPTLGLAMLACAVRIDEEGKQNQKQNDNSKKKVLSYLLLDGESSRPSSHLLIRWPSSPLSANLFFSPIIQEIHPQYLFQIHQKFSELLRKISSHLHRHSLEQQPEEHQNLQNTADSPLHVPTSSTKTSTAISHLFFTGGGSSKPSLDTIKKIFETQRFRSVRSSGFEVDVASASAPFFVANTEGDLSNEHAFNINSYSRVTDFIASSSADMGDGLEDGILEILQRSDVGLLSQESKEGLMVLSKKSCVRFGYGAGAAGGGTQPSYDEIAGSASMQILKAIDESPEFDTARQDAYGGVDQQMAVLEQLEQNEAELSKMKILSKTASSSSSKTRPGDENCDDELEIRKMLHADLRRDRKIDQVVHFDEKASPLFMRNLFSKSVTSFEWEFRDVSFAYPSTSTDSPPLVLKNISFTIPASVKSCGICGESGSGKSSILALMLKVYQPTKGEILLNGVNINDIPARWLRRHIAYVGPGSKLFKSQTARGQVLTANPLIENDVDATKALRDACVPERMFSQRDQQQLIGNQTFPKAAMMSGGEQQRVQIARAFGKMVMSRKSAPSQENGVDDDEEDEDIFSDDRVIALLFDEGTSALDAKTEEQIVKAIEDTGRSTSITRFMIAHRLFTIRDCDTILVIHNHRLIIKGKFFECARKAHRALEIAKEESKNEQKRKNATSSFSKHTIAGLKWFYDGVEKQIIKGEESAFLKLVQSPGNATELNFGDDDGSEFSNDQQVSTSTANTSGFASDNDEHE